ncbi:hypothetical protein HDV04_002552 [Boothiomyces sp. JEL0838]|nr:hypothetical protein HDV04_002552 [Boothiomyces sp. JEL0838]
MNELVFREASKVTLAYIGSFIFTIGIQVAFKVKSVKNHQQLKKTGSKEKYDRYQDEIMIPVDRSVGNFMEWQGSFILLFWMNAYLRGQDIWVGWIYVAVRMVYPLLALAGGVSRKGAQPLIFLTTVPGYAVLSYYGYQIYKALYQ